MFDVIGTTVTVAWGRRTATAFAVLLLTTTAGRVVLTSDPVAGSNDTRTI